MAYSVFQKAKHKILIFLGGKYLHGWDVWFFPIFKTKNIVLIDDGFPVNQWIWRTIEINTYLKEFSHIEVLCTGLALKKNQNELFEENLKLQATNSYRVRKMPKYYFKKPHFIYVLFLTNAVKISELTAQNKIPFGFTCYPGGGFGSNYLKNELSFDKLDFQNLKFIFTTQYATTKLFLKSKYREDLIKKSIFIHGVPLIDKNFNIKFDHLKNTSDKKLNFGFVAHRYTEKGLEKGFDLLIEIASHFSFNKNIHFYVVGNFDAQIIPNSLTNISYLGVLADAEYKNVFKNFHVFLSLSKKVNSKTDDFDGFPLSPIIDASMNSCAIITTDEMSESIHFENFRESFIIVDTKSKEIIEAINKLISNPNKINTLAELSFNAILSHFSFENQVTPRVNTLKKYINQ